VSDLLKNAIILDTETLGLERGAGMHELAIFDLQRNHVQGFVLKPNAVTVQTIPQEHTKLAGSLTDKYTAHKYGTWMQALHEQVERLAGRSVPAGMTMNLLQEQQPWLAGMLKHYPHLLDENNSENAASILQRQKLFKKHGITSELNGKPVVMTEALDTLRQQMSGKTVWIANAVFESKQIGAQLGAMGDEAALNFKSGLETYNPMSPDPFYVTGSEVTKARTIAQATGDYTGVWKAYKRYTPKAGETAVRDIQDVTRALHSYGKKLGLTSKDFSYLGTGIDISHRLHAIAAGDKQRIGLKEMHRAAEDAAIHESYVLRRNIRLVEMAQAIDEGTDVGHAYLKQGMNGPLNELATYFEALETHAPLLQEEAATKRIQRAMVDLQTQGYTSQRQGGSPYVQQQLTPGGDFVDTFRTTSHRSTYHNMEDVIKHVEAEGRYSQVNLRAIAQEMEGLSKTDLDSFVEERVRSLQNQQKKLKIGGADGRLGKLLRRPTSNVATEFVADVFTNMMRAKVGGVFGGAAAIATFIGAGASMIQEPPPAPDTIMHYGYDQWFERQRIEGLSEGQVAADHRHMYTDFGSPYQGPVGAMQVFMDQELLREREKFLRAQYGARHANIKAPGLPIFDPFGQMGYSFIPGGKAVRGEDYAMRGNLMKINLDEGNWNITAEDADTVTLRRGGLVGSLQSFFGLNKGYSFRLAGLDSTEVEHGDRPAQPYANQAADAFRQMLASSKNLEVVFDPTEMTYGRMLGAVVADGKNLNYELVRRGIASHLPFGNPRDAIVDYRAMKDAETRAYAGNRGMWATPWARSFYEHSEASGNRVTFNTLAKTESIVKNFGSMQMITAMEQAQADGMFSRHEMQLATDLGGKYNVGEDKVGPWSMTAVSAPSTSYLQEQLKDLSGFIRTKGRGQNANKFSRRNGYGTLDKNLVLDSMGTGTTVWNQRRKAAFVQYNTDKHLAQARKARMAFQQRKTLQAMSSSPIAHHRM